MTPQPRPAFTAVLIPAGEPPRIVDLPYSPARRVDHPGNPRGCETWEDAGSWWHSGSIRRSCVNAR